MRRQRYCPNGCRIEVPRDPKMKGIEVIADPDDGLLYIRQPMNNAGNGKVRCPQCRKVVAFDVGAKE